VLNKFTFPVTRQDKAAIKSFAKAVSVVTPDKAELVAIFKNFGSHIAGPENFHPTASGLPDVRYLTEMLKGVQRKARLPFIKVRKTRTPKVENTIVFNNQTYRLVKSA